jgi:hypothetical protein
MVYFQTKYPDLGKFWRALDRKFFIYLLAIWNILWKIGIFYDHLVHFVFIWYIFRVLVSCTMKNLATLVEGTPWALTTLEIAFSGVYAMTAMPFHLFRGEFRSEGSHGVAVDIRVARFFFGTKYQNGKICTKLPCTILNVHKI